MTRSNGICVVSYKKGAKRVSSPRLCTYPHAATTQFKKSNRIYTDRITRVDLSHAPNCQTHFYFAKSSYNYNFLTISIHFSVEKDLGL